MGHSLVFWGTIGDLISGIKLWWVTVSLDIFVR